MHQDNGCSGRGRDTLPVQVQMNKEAARPSVCTHTEPKTLVWTPQERNPNITPAPSTDTCGQCHSTDKRGAGGRDCHHTSPCKTQWPKHPTASLNTQGTDADCTVQHPAADTRCVNAPSARTHPKPKTRFALTNDIYSFAAPNGGAAREALTSVLSKIGSPLPLPEQPNQKRRPHRRLFLWNNSLSDVPLPIPHGSLLPLA